MAHQSQKIHAKRGVDACTHTHEENIGRLHSAAHLSGKKKHTGRFELTAATYLGGRPARVNWAPKG